jgi:hypothetical protein
MSRIIQQKAIKGSQHWLQELISQRPDLLANKLRSQIGLSGDDMIEWLAPLEADGYAEYSDDAFLNLLSVHLENRPLSSFWPSRGPVWDGVGKTSRGDVLLVEAKAHISELASGPCRANPLSLDLIQQSLAEARQFFGEASNADWSKDYYQYANRLAYLYLLRELNGIPAWLVFLYFLNDSDMDGPKTKEDWQPAIDAVHTSLGLRAGRVNPHLVDIFIDIAPLQI